MALTLYQRNVVTELLEKILSEFKYNNRESTFDANVSISVSATLRGGIEEIIEKIKNSKTVKDPLKTDPLEKVIRGTEFVNVVNNEKLYQCFGTIKKALTLLERG